jgi:hypothetical protein
MLNWQLLGPLFLSLNMEPFSFVKPEQVVILVLCGNEVNMAVQLVFAGGGRPFQNVSAV